MDFSSLIDQAAIAAADSALAAAGQRVTDAEMALATAQAGVTSAQAASAAAIATGGDGVLQESAIATAQLRVSAASKVLAAARAALPEANAAHRAATGRAFRQVFWTGLQNRIAACAAGDKARADLAAAEAAYRDSAEQILAAARAGFPMPTSLGPLQGANIIQPLQDEQALWERQGYNIEAETFRGNSL